MMINSHTLAEKRSIVGFVLVICGFSLMTVAQPLQAKLSCADVEINSNAALVMGELRSMPYAKGFIELHPIHGISISGTGASHSGLYGLAELTVSGPHGAEILIQLTTLPSVGDFSGSISFAELLVLSTNGLQRIAATGGEVKVMLSGRANQKDYSQQRFQVGAVFKYRHAKGKNHVKYQLTARCLSLNL